MSQEPQIDPQVTAVPARGRSVDLTVYLTSYDEEKTIEGAMSRIAQVLSGYGYNYEVIIVDDCSSDRSVAVISDYIASHGLADRFRLVVNEKNEGIGVNYYRAAEMGQGEYFIVLFGDNPIPVESMKAVFDRLGESDMVIPHYNTRVFNMKENWDHRTLSRRLISVTYTRIIQWISGHHLAYFNGFVLHRRKNVLKHRVATFGLGYQAEMMTKILDDPGVSYVAVKVHNHDRLYGMSTAFSPRNVLSVMGSVWRIFLRRVKR